MRIRKIIKLFFVCLATLSIVACEEDTPDKVNQAPSVSDQSFSIQEASPEGTIVGTVLATDPDQDDLIFSITSENADSSFAVHPSSGQITVATATLDFEHQRSYSLTITVSDGELSDSAVVTITLLNIDESVAPVVADQAFSIDENSADSTVVGTIKVDHPSPEELTFFITAGNTDDVFMIHPSSGELRVNTSSVLDFESTPSFTLTVTIRHGSVEVTTNVVISLLDVDEYITPVVVDQTFSVDENSADNTVIGIFQVNHPNPTELTFSIVDGNTSDAFAIDTASGALRVNSSSVLDFESITAFALTVAVRHGSAEAAGKATITLNDVTGELFTSQAEINQNLNDSYTALARYLEHAYLFDAIYTNTIEAPTDWDDVHAHRLFSLDAKVSQLWFEAYDLLTTINTTIASAAEFSSGSEQETVTGQARIMRAYLHFNLLVWFGSVPLSLNIDSDDVVQATEEELLLSINSDLAFSIDALPSQWSTTEPDKFTKAAAQLLRARVAAFEQDWTTVADLTAALTNSETYTLSEKLQGFAAADSEAIWGFAASNYASFSSLYTEGTYVPVFRLTEAYLLSAEGNVQLGNIVAAQSSLNALRERAGEDPTSSVDSNELLNMTFEQWQSEMSREGHTFATLKRLDKVISQLSIQDYQQVLPLPQSAIDNNTNLFQNPGY